MWLWPSASWLCCSPVAIPPEPRWLADRPSAVGAVAIVAAVVAAVAGGATIQHSPQTQRCAARSSDAEARVAGLSGVSNGGSLVLVEFLEHGCAQLVKGQSVRLH
jgi:hypothetical protein